MGRMDKTLPKAPKSLGRTRHVLDSCQLAVRGLANPLGFKPVTSVVSVLVDGLGYRQLEQVAGHASTIWKNAKPIKSAFPATTSVNIKSFASGLTPAQHGFLGYRLRHRQGVTNLLSDMEKIDIAEFDTTMNLSQVNSSDCQFSVVSMEEYRDSGFSRVTMRGSEYQAAETIAERFAKAAQIAQKDNQVIYLYIPELDKTGHKTGWGSAKWLEYLEEVEAGVRSLVGQNIPVTLTSDHGMVNTRPELQIHLDEFVPGDEIEAMVGDTRCTYLHTKLSKQYLQEVLQDQPLNVFESSELEGAGWFGGEVADEFRYRLPEIILIALGDHVILHREFNSERAYKMVGHHGTFDDRELEVPLMRIGI